MLNGTLEIALCVSRSPRGVGTYHGVGYNHHEQTICNPGLVPWR